MAYDTWGGSWGSSWALSWTRSGDVTPPITPPVVTQTPAGKSTPSRKRWWRVGSKVYFGTEAEAERFWDAYLAQEEGEEVELPKLKSKPAPRLVAAKKAEPLPPEVVIPEFDYPAIDWRPLYEIMVRQKDMESAAMLARAIQKRLDDDEEDIEAILMMLPTWH